MEVPQADDDEDGGARWNLPAILHALHAFLLKCKAVHLGMQGKRSWASHEDHREQLAHNRGRVLRVEHLALGL